MSLKSNPPLQIVQKNQIFEGETLWNDSNHTIKQIEFFLRGSTLFKLPKKNVKGASLTMTCPMNSDIYIAYKRRRENVMGRCSSASDVLDFEGQEGWNVISGKVIYKSYKNLPYACLGSYSKRSSLTSLLHHRISSNTTVDLPRPNLDGSLAIFLVEGMP